MLNTSNQIHDGAQHCSWNLGPGLAYFRSVSCVSPHDNKLIENAVPSEYVKSRSAFLTSAIRECAPRRLSNGCSLRHLSLRRDKIRHELASNGHT